MFAADCTRILSDRAVNGSPFPFLRSDYLVAEPEGVVLVPLKGFEFQRDGSVLRLPETVEHGWDLVATVNAWYHKQDRFP